MRRPLNNKSTATRASGIDSVAAEEWDSATGDALDRAKVDGCRLRCKAPWQPVDS